MAGFAARVLLGRGDMVSHHRSSNVAPMSPQTVAAIAFALVAVAVIGFQVALALGAPWGAYAMGGARPGRLPGGMRVAAVVQALLIAGLAVVVLSDAELLSPSISGTFPWLIWVVVAFSALSTVLNAITPSGGERRLWLPVAILMLGTSLVLALS